MPEEKQYPRKQNRSRERGAMAVEFAIILPLVLLLLYGILEMGRIMMVQNMATSSAREGARTAILPGATNDAVTTRVTSVLSGAGLAYDSLATDPEDVSTVDGDNPITVTVAIDYDDYSLIPGFIEGLQLTGQVTMRKEGF